MFNAFLLQFRDALKQELRLLKQEIDLLPKDRRKDEFRKRKNSMEVEHEEREKQFLANLSEQHGKLKQERIFESQFKPCEYFRNRFTPHKRNLPREDGCDREKLLATKTNREFC